MGAMVCAAAAIDIRVFTVWFHLPRAHYFFFQREGHFFPELLG